MTMRSFGGLQFFDFGNEVGCFLKPAVDTGEADVSDVVEFAQTFHDELADEFARHFALEFFRDDGDDVIHEVVNRLRADGTFLAGFLDAGQKFFAGKFLAPPVALQNHETLVLDFLVSGEAVAAFGAFAAAADGRAFARGARINDLVILITAFWATHKTTANCGCTFVTHWILWVKKWFGLGRKASPTMKLPRRKWQRA